MELTNSIFFSCLIFLSIFVHSSQTKIDPVFGKARYSLIELSKQSENLSHFTDSLREEHMKVVGEMQNYIINFTQENINSDTDKVENTVKKYLLRLKTSVKELNQKFDSQYKSCKDNLSSYSIQCHTSISKLGSQIKYNNQYIKSLHDIDQSLAKTITSYYQSNMLSSMKEVNQLCQKDSIVALYNKITKQLSTHFHLITNDKLEQETKGVDVKDDKKLDSFLQKVIMRINSHKILVPKKDDESNAEKKNREAKEKFLKERSEFANILYNKAVTYMSNAIQRKKDLSCIETDLLTKMKANDVKIQDESKKLEEIRKANAKLIVSVNKDNETNRSNVKRCQVMKNVSIKCKEMANIYQSILNSYDEQSQALDRIFAILKK